MQNWLFDQPLNNTDLVDGDRTAAPCTWHSLTF